MATYSIKDLENFTKIKAHTLRIWEQRYALLNPERTETNVRFYSDKDLKKILNINLLYQNGLKISKIAKLSELEIFEKAADFLQSDKASERDDINALVENIMELNEQAIQAILKRNFDSLGMEGLYSDVLIPLLEKIGTLWQVDAISVSHEHFISNIIREFLILQISAIKVTAQPKGKVILFLHEHEKHELSLLFYYYILKKRNYSCFYLGQSVPMKDLRTMCEEVGPDYLVTSLIAEVTAEEFDDLFSQLAEIIALDKIFAGGVQLMKFSNQVDKKVNLIQHVNDIKL